MSPERKLLERIISHMEKQGEFALVSNSSICVYRQEKGKHKKVLKCAVGCLIPKSDYTPVMEGATVNEKGNPDFILYAYEALTSFLEKSGLIKYRDFLSKMQTLHDGYAHCTRFRGKDEVFDEYLNDLRAMREEYA